MTDHTLEQSEQKPSIDDRSSPSSISSAVGVSLAPGVATAVAMWIVWWIAHLPAVQAPGGPFIAILALTMVVSLALWGRWAGRRSGPIAGVGGGAVAALLNLLLLGSRLVEQPTHVDQMESAAGAVRPDATVFVAGFLAVSAVAGIFAGWAGSRMTHREAPPSPRDTLTALAIAGIVAFLPLLVVGGAVTSTESGMAVPDAFTTYGAPSFLFPLSLMAGEWGSPKIFLEHTHRLFGSLVGLITIIVAIWTFAIDRRWMARGLAIAVFGLVTTQGVLGALRVSENSPALAFLHGIFGQGVFASAVVLASVVHYDPRDGVPSLPAKTVRAARIGYRVGLAALVVVAIQLALGAASRHFGASHATWTHAGWGFITAGTVAIAGALLASADRDTRQGRGLRRVGRGLTHVVGLQFLLGWVVIWQVTQDESKRPILESVELASATPVDVFEATVATAHQAIGAGILALATLAVVCAARWQRAPSSADPT
ncbi:MAG: hypothetical protein CMJ31_04385 [Phycisphaerae bacterium]|nr:hypothetical protein [Phycisphaerae bacterium]